MTKRNRIGKVCLAAVVVLFVLMSTFTCTFAAVPDFDRKCSITFTMAYNGEPISGGSLKMYRIASYAFMDNSYGYKWVPELEDCGLSFTRAGTEEFARRIFMLVETRSLPAMQKLIGKDGTVTFGNLDTGLYVVYQTEPPHGYEPINPFCVSLPMPLGDGGEDYLYDVQASPKPRPEKPDPTKPTDDTPPTGGTPTTPSTNPTNPTNPDTPPTNPPEHTTLPGETTTYTTSVYEPESPPIISMEDKLPQTGQLWWPTWMLGAFGLILLGLGILMRFLLRQSAEDAEV